MHQMTNPHRMIADNNVTTGFTSIRNRLLNPKLNLTRLSLLSGVYSPFVKSFGLGEARGIMRITGAETLNVLLLRCFSCNFSQRNVAWNKEIRKKINVTITFARS